MIKNKLMAFIKIMIILLTLFSLGSEYFCIFKRVFGIPCPTCGLTRSYEFLVRGNIKNAFYYHPLFLLFPFIALLIALYDVEIMKKILSKKIVIIIIGVLIMGTWIVRMVLFFPDKPPMDFNESSLLAFFYRFIIKFF